MSVPIEMLESLEFKLSYVEQGLAQLSDVLHRQQQQIDALTAQCQRLARQVESLPAGGSDAPTGHEVPPHY